MSKYRLVSPTMFKQIGRAVPRIPINVSKCTTHVYNSSYIIINSSARCRKPCPRTLWISQPIRLFGNKSKDNVHALESDFDPSMITRSEDSLERFELEEFLKRIDKEPVPTVTLNDLLRFQDKISADRKAVLNDNANETLKDLFILVGRAIQRFLNLPYIAVMNPHMAKIYKCYTDTLYKLLLFVDGCSEQNAVVLSSSLYDSIEHFHITSKKQEAEFIRVLSKILEIHTDNTVDLREAFDEIQSGLVDEKVFLDAHMKERILMRLLINHHLLLHEQLLDAKLEWPMKSIGSIDMNVDVLDILSRSYDYVNDMAAMKYSDKIKMEVKSVLVKADGSIREQIIHEIDHFEKYEPLVFPYISNHIQYVFDEILKNSTRATMDNNVSIPVEVVVVLREPKSTEDYYKLEVRITDHAKGIKPEVVDHLFDYSFTTVNDETSSDPKLLTNTSDNMIAGMGYGLPMSLTYTRLFDGNIHLKSVFGEGTTVYLEWTGIAGKNIMA